MTISELICELQKCPLWYPVYLNGSPVTSINPIISNGEVNISIEALVTGSHCPVCYQKMTEDD